MKYLFFRYPMSYLHRLRNKLYAFTANSLTMITGLGKSVMLFESGVKERISQYQMYNT